MRAKCQQSAYHLFLYTVTKITPRYFLIEPLCITSGFWPRVRARALRAPVFLGSLPCQTGRCAPPLPAHCSFAVSYFTPKNILNLSNLGSPCQGPFSFHRNTEAMKYEVNLPPASPIAALLILPAIFLGQNYVPVPPYALNFLVFYFL